jgi:pimeloyl-ACP methyl ester carboxylesterase
MTAFVLVHGAYHGGWCWQRVAPLLRAEGHDVYCPTLTGLGDRRHLAAPRVTALTHALDVANLMEFEDLRDAILVGHSYAGVVISKALESVHDRVRQAVYLDAIVLHSGEVYADTRPPEWRERTYRNASEHGFGFLIPPPAPAFFGVTEPADVAWVQPRLTPQPLATMSEPVDLHRFYELSTPRTYVHCSAFDLVLHADRASALGWSRIDLDAQHDLMVTEPQRLAQLLLEVEAGSRRSAGE